MRAGISTIPVLLLGPSSDPFVPFVPDCYSLVLSGVSSGSCWPLTALFIPNERAIRPHEDSLAQEVSEDSHTHHNGLLTKQCLTLCLLKYI